MNSLRHIVSTVSFASLFVCSLFGRATAQQDSLREVPGATIDSLSKEELNTKEILRADSLRMLFAPPQDKPAKQYASMREIDLDNDGKPEKLRVSVNLIKPVDNSTVVFTISQGRKVLFKDSWKVSGYFDAVDSLPEEVKLHRLRRIINVFFANENFVLLDSNNLVDVMKMGDSADIRPNTPECKELMCSSHVMYSVFNSRDYWYGLSWLPSKKKLVKVWRN